MYTQTATAAASQGRGTRTSLSQAARRTGLADSELSMAQVCTDLEIPTARIPASAAGRGYVALAAFAGEPVRVDLGDVVVLERGRL